MISKETIDRIFDAARIEEVVGDFVQLKKRGANYIGLCPFHNEKTPSFNVSPVRNIYKCFGCGKGGNAVNFVMEHEHYTYPEALRFIAGKYAIEIEETIPDPKELEARDERESLYVLNSFAQKTFSEFLFDTEEGQAVGLSYFKERGFNEDIIRKFQLGYSPNQWSGFSDKAIEQGHNPEFLLKTGLSIARKTEEGKEESTPKKLLDRFRGRIMFPVHNLSGRIIAFGGRILKKDEKSAKYINSPESEIYHKGKSLYGIYFAKKSIVERDNCFLVEGYTDVISLHQSGIENVVASSGTALTPDQIRLIGRYTKNITILYDGDAAGIKASMRGIDLILEEGLHVRIVLFPDGDDPDSYRRRHGSSVLVDFIRDNAKDFVMFKTGLLLQEASNDPVKTAELINEISQTIAKIPDPITRAVYAKQTSQIMQIEEQLLVNQVNRFKRQLLKQELPKEDVDELLKDTINVHLPDHQLSLEFLEKEIVRILLNYFDLTLKFYTHEGNSKEPEAEHHVGLGNYLIDELQSDEISLATEPFAALYRNIIAEFNSNGSVDINKLCNSRDPAISSLAVDLLTHRHFLSRNWDLMHKIPLVDETSEAETNIPNLILRYKKRKLDIAISENRERLKESPAEFEKHYEEYMRLKTLHIRINADLGTVVNG